MQPSAYRCAEGAVNLAKWVLSVLSEKKDTTVLGLFDRGCSLQAGRTIEEAVACSPLLSSLNYQIASVNKIHTPWHSGLFLG